MNAVSLPPPANQAASPSTANAVTPSGAPVNGTSTSKQGESLTVAPVTPGMREDPSKVATPAKVEPAAAETPATDPLAKAKAVRDALKGRNKYLESVKAAEQQKTRELGQTSAELQASRTRLQAAEAQLEAIRRDPLAAMKALGISKEDLYKSAVMDGTPEAQLAQLRRELETERTERLKEREGEKRVREQQAQNAAETAFLKASKDPAAYPHLVGEPDHVVLLVAKDMLQGAVKRGVDVSRFSDAEILAALDQYYSGHKKAAVTQQAAASAVDSASPGTTASANQAAPRTISNGLASASFTPTSGKAPSAAVDDWANRKYLAAQIKGKFVRPG